MIRRDSKTSLIVFVIGAFALDAQAQQPAKVFRIGWLSLAAPADPELPRKAAEQKVKNLKGATAREMPVEKATQIHRTINLKTAKALGLAMPQSLLLLCSDDVIQ